MTMSRGHVGAIAVVLVAVVIVGSLGLRRQPPPPDPPQRPASLEVGSTAAELLDELFAATAARPRHPAPRAQLARAYHANGLLALAAPTYLQAVHADGTEPGWWYLMAICRRNLGDLQGADQALTQARTLAPNDSVMLRRTGAW